MKKETILKTLRVVNSKVKNGQIIDDEVCFGSSNILFFDRVPEGGENAITKSGLKIGKIVYQKIEDSDTLIIKLKENIDISQWKTGARHLLLPIH